MEERSTSGNRGIGRIAVVAAIGLLSAFGARGVGCLAKIGPNPLRLQAAHASSLANLPSLSMDNSDIPPVRRIPIKPAEDIKMTAGAGFLPRYLSPWPIWPGSLTPANADHSLSDAPEEATNSLPKVSPASDVLTVTPQMLIDYFRPQRSTNASVSVVAPVTFTPAVPAPAESSAAYKSP